MKNMNNWLKRSLAGLLCMSLMVFCMLPVSAAECRHNYTHTAVKRILGYDSGSHTYAICDFQQCTICEYSHFVELSRGVENHDIVYTDLGVDSNGAHHYNAHCNVCGFDQTM